MCACVCVSVRACEHVSMRIRMFACACTCVLVAGPEAGAGHIGALPEKELRALRLGAGPGLKTTSVSGRCLADA